MSGRIEIKHLRRRELIDAVRLVIARDGFEATTISKIATQAGFSIGFMHHHFPNKHALLAEAMRVIYGDMGRLIVSRLQEVTEPLNRLRVIVEGNFDDEIFTPANAFVWISYVPRVPFNPLFARLQRVGVQALHGERAGAGRVAPGDCSPEALSRTGQGDFHHRMLSTTYDGVCGELDYVAKSAEPVR